MSVLNPILFKALVRVFKKVKIYSRGEHGNYATEYSVHTWDISAVARQWGETYAVCCPFCGDRKFHLYFSHRFGFRDPITKKYYRRTVWCFHNCLEHQPERVKQLYKMLFPEGQSLFYTDENMLKSDQLAEDDLFGDGGHFLLSDETHTADLFERLSTVEWPGKCVPLRQLTEDHPAIVYLKDRGFDIEELSLLWKVRYCVDSYNPLLKHRIIIPIYFRDKMVGYQARKVGEPHDGEPKYYFSRNFPKSIVWYNVERATDYETVVIVEGVTDVWKIGENATAIFGLRTNPEAINVFTSLLFEKHQGNATVCVCLDPDLPLNTKTHQHQIHVLTRQLSSNLYRIKTVVPIWLPAGTDPGSLDREYLRNYIQESIYAYKAAKEKTTRASYQHL